MASEKQLVREILTTENDKGWSVTVQNLNTKETVTSDFKAMMICNGHYSIPSLPNLPGLPMFSGIAAHSHDYRIPDPYKGKTVAILGAAASGTGQVFSNSIRNQSPQKMN